MLEEEVRQMIAENNLLSPRSTILALLCKVSDTARQFARVENRLLKKYLQSVFNTVLYETRDHVKNYQMLKSKEQRILCFFEFEYLLNTLNYKTDFSADPTYKAIREVFNDLNRETVDSMKVMTYYRVRLKALHLRYYFIFNFQAIQTS